MSGKVIGIALAAVVVAFGAAFAIGSATKSSGTTASEPSPVKAFKPDAAQTQLASYQPSGSLPAPKKEKKKPKSKPSGGGGGGGGGGAGPAPSRPYTPPSRPVSPPSGGGGRPSSGGGGAPPPASGGGD
jgi:hypothetical protein